MWCKHVSIITTIIFFPSTTAPQSSSRDMNDSLTNSIEALTLNYFYSEPSWTHQYHHISCSQLSHPILRSTVLSSSHLHISQKSPCIVPCTPSGAASADPDSSTEHRSTPNISAALVLRVFRFLGITQSWVNSKDPLSQALWSGDPQLATKQDTSFKKNVDVEI